MVLFVGDKPSPRMKPGARPFEGAACERRIKTWINYIISYKYGYAVVNQSDYDCFHKYLLWAYEDKSPIIALGKEAARAIKEAGMKCYVLPHPSGRNRQLNDNAFIQAKLEACKKYIESHNNTKV